MDPNFDDDDEAVDKSDLLSQEKGAISPKYSFGNFSDSTGSAGGGTSSNTGLSSGGTGDSTSLGEPGFFKRDSTSDTPQALNKAENSSLRSSPVSSVTNAAVPLNNLKNVFWGTSNRKRASVGGGVAGVLAGLIVSFSVASGPFEFIHIAQLMDKFHFSAIHDAENSRLEKIAQYIYDPNRPERTRLGLVGNAIADQLEAKIKSATGLSPYYDETGTFKGWVADESSFSGQSTEEIKSTMAEELGTDPSSIGSFEAGGKQVLIYNPDGGGFNTITRYRAQVGTASDLFNKSGFNDVSSYVASRVLKSRAGWTFHPIKALDSAYQAKIFKAGKSALDKLKEQFNQQEQANIDSDTTTPPTTIEDSQEENSSGQTQPDQTREGAAGAGQSVNTDASESNINSKIAGGGAALIGVACIMNGINKAAPGLRMAKVVLPMMKFAGQFVNLGSQAESGQDIDTIQLSFFKQFLHGTNSSGQPTSWDQSKSIQAELGQPETGPDLPKSAQVFNGSVPFAFLNGVPALNTTCDALGSPLGTILSSIISPLTTAFQTLVVGPILKDAVGSLANWLTGVPINIFKGAGATDGSFINYGSKLSGDEQFASAGGIPISTGQSLALKNTTNSIDNTEFQSKSLAYRIFDPYNDQTLASKVIDNYGVQSATQDMSSLFTNVGSVFSSTFSDLASLFTGLDHSSALDPTYSYNNLEDVGFSESDLTNPAYKDPFVVGCEVAGGPGCPASDGNGVLGDPNDSNSAFNQVYKNKILTCFGDTVTWNQSENNGSGAWDVNFTNSGPLDMYGSPSENTPYQQADCGSTDPDWTKIRFWLLDTQSIEGYDCYAGNTSTADQSCQDLGDDTGSSTSTTSTGSTTSSTTSTTTSTAGATIDMSSLYSDSTNVACAANTKDIGVYDGYTSGNLVKIRLCAISNLPSSGEEANGQDGVTGANGFCPLNSRVSGAVYAMVQAAQQAGVTLTTSSCFRTMAHQQALQGQGVTAAKPGYSNHQMGLAMDFSVPICETTINGQCSDPSNSIWSWLNQNATRFGFKSGVASEAWHWSPTGN